MFVSRDCEFLVRTKHSFEVALSTPRVNKSTDGSFREKLPAFRGSAARQARRGVAGELESWRAGESCGRDINIASLVTSFQASVLAITAHSRLLLHFRLFRFIWTAFAS
jgi:hypothetical protein